jgi:hypothetical protein
MLNLQRADPGTYLLPRITIDRAGWLLFGAVVVVTLIGIWRKRSPDALLLAMGITALAYFDLTVGQRERYVYPAIVLFLAAAFYYRWNLLLVLVTSVAMFLDLGATIVWNASYIRPGVDLSAWNTFLSAYPKLYIGISLINMVVKSENFCKSVSW